MITPIEKLSPVIPETPVSVAGTGPYLGDQSVFGSIFRTAIDNVKETTADRVQSEYLLATGQLDNPAALTVAWTKESAAVELLIQLRNKALDAYSELSRMSL